MPGWRVWIAAEVCADRRASWIAASGLGKLRKAVGGPVVVRSPSNLIDTARRPFAPASPCLHDPERNRPRCCIASMRQGSSGGQSRRRPGSTAACLRERRTWPRQGRGRRRRRRGTAITRCAARGRSGRCSLERTRRARERCGCRHRQACAASGRVDRRPWCGCRECRKGWECRARSVPCGQASRTHAEKMAEAGLDQHLCNKNLAHAPNDPSSSPAAGLLSQTG